MQFTCVVYSLLLDLAENGMFLLIKQARGLYYKTFY